LPGAEHFTFDIFKLAGVFLHYFLQCKIGLVAENALCKTWRTQKEDRQKQEDVFHTGGFANKIVTKSLLRNRKTTV
jgi:hypothetical protein